MLLNLTYCFILTFSRWYLVNVGVHIHLDQAKNEVRVIRWRTLPPYVFLVRNFIDVYSEKFGERASPSAFTKYEHVFKTE